MGKGSSSDARVPGPALVVKAAQAADLVTLKQLVARGGDVNASWRNYQPLHALLQEKPHGVEYVATEERFACLDWLLAQGADPDSLGAWPSARAILIAAFVGVPEFVERLRAAGARVDLHVQAALGEVAAVRKALERDVALADARDAGELTPLMTCAGSRLGRDDVRRRRRQSEVAILLLDAGADPNARVRSWGHDVDVAYFAIGAGQSELLELLLARGADANRALVSAVWRAPNWLSSRSPTAPSRTARARAIDRS